MRHLLLSIVFVLVICGSIIAQTPAKPEGQVLAPMSAEELQNDYFNMKVYEKYHPLKPWPRKIPPIRNLVRGVFKMPNNRSWYLPSDMIGDYRRGSKHVGISVTFQIRPAFSWEPKIKGYKPN